MQTRLFEGQLYTGTCFWPLWWFPGRLRLAVSLSLPFPPLTHHVSVCLRSTLPLPPPSIQSLHTYGPHVPVWPHTLFCRSTISCKGILSCCPGSTGSRPPLPLSCCPPPAPEMVPSPKQTTSMYPNPTIARFAFVWPLTSLPPGSQALHENFLLVFFFMHVWLTFTEVQSASAECDEVCRSGGWTWTPSPPPCRPPCPIYLGAGGQPQGLVLDALSFPLAHPGELAPFPGCKCCLYLDSSRICSSQLKSHFLLPAWHFPWKSHRLPRPHMSTWRSSFRLFSFSSPALPQPLLHTYLHLSNRT